MDGSHLDGSLMECVIQNPIKVFSRYNVHQQFVCPKKRLIFHRKNVFNFSFFFKSVTLVTFNFHIFIYFYFTGDQVKQLLLWHTTHIESLKWMPQYTYFIYHLCIKKLGSSYIFFILYIHLLNFFLLFFQAICHPQWVWGVEAPIIWACHHLAEEPPVLVWCIQTFMDPFRKNEVFQIWENVALIPVVLELVALWYHHQRLWK